jgi:peptide/nickel transport system ATP-binding protein
LPVDIAVLFGDRRRSWRRLFQGFGVNALVEAHRVTRHYPVGKRWPWLSPQILRAVDGVSFEIHRGETLGIVGESGSGKSTLAQIVLGLAAPTSGQVLFAGRPVGGVDTRTWRALRREMQLVFQDPLGALNPRLTVGRQIEEPLVIHGAGNPQERGAIVQRILDAVHLKKSLAERYPHELSGGQRQRVVLARALILEPKLIVCDEPVSALDVSVQAQIVNLLADLKTRLGLTMLFISHDLRIVRYVSDRVAVMYLGRIVETGDRRSIFSSPQHPYSHALISAVPELRTSSGPRPRIRLQGEPPSPIFLPAGCRFRSRCGRATSICAEVEPELAPAGPTMVACHHPGPAIGAAA